MLAVSDERPRADLCWKRGMLPGSERRLLGQVATVPVVEITAEVVRMPRVQIQELSRHVP